VPDAAGPGPGSQRAVVEAARELRAAGRAFVLTLVVEAEGSTYRKPGALALVAEDGRRVGVISGGCLEPGLVEHGRGYVELLDDEVFDDLTQHMGSMSSWAPAVCGLSSDRHPREIFIGPDQQSRPTVQIVPR